ncbi:hypothetical protein, partial [Burkholderia pyrrocinia]|uniref:hypothetical protein n=1 Tax=Burkholderia pyrrocinia TaxID=60550 RepID=UPI001ABADFAB
LLEAKNRESTQEPESLTGVSDRLLCVNVNRPRAHPINATTPFSGTAPHRIAAAPIGLHRLRSRWLIALLPHSPASLPIWRDYRPRDERGVPN